MKLPQENDHLTTKLTIKPKTTKYTHKPRLNSKPTTVSKKPQSKALTKIIPLGGLEEIGKNTYCVEHDNEIILIDAGVKFPEKQLLGIEAVIPNYSYLIENKTKIRAIFVTHGHEDHIGGIPYLLKVVPVPIIYAPKLAVALIREKLREHHVLNRTKLVEVDNTSVIRTRYFEATYFAVNHSIPDAFGVCLKTPNGTVVSTGDYKFDWTPLGHKSDVDKMAAMGKKGVTFFMADSTNSEIDGYTMTEAKVIDRISDIFAKAKGRILISTFASNVHRIQQIIEVADKYHRKILVFGRSMDKIIRIVSRISYLNVKQNAFIKPQDADKYKPNQILIICTGSQGEPLAALSKIAHRQHRFVSIIPGDTVVFSSSPIPGNKESVENIVNDLTHLGAIVLENSPFNSLHTSGHASQEEQKLMLTLIKPRYFMPMHGDYRMLKEHGNTAIKVGVNPRNVFICGNGDVINIFKGRAWLAEQRVDADAIYVENNDMSGASTAVISDRDLMSQNGVIAVTITIDSQNNKLLGSPIFVARGCFYIQSDIEFLKSLTGQLVKALQDIWRKQKPTFAAFKATIKSVVAAYVFQKKHRNPLIIPVILSKITNSNNPNNSTSGSTSNLKSVDEQRLPTTSLKQPIRRQKPKFKSAPNNNIKKESGNSSRNLPVKVVKPKAISSKKPATVPPKTIKRPRTKSQSNLRPKINKSGSPLDNQKNSWQSNGKSKPSTDK